MPDAPCVPMDIFTILTVGLVAGGLASLVVRRVGCGILEDAIIGVGGAFVGSYLFARTGWDAPLVGIGGTMVIATIGAAILLVTGHRIRALMLSRRRPPGVRS
jgi:uncharacterized membrane protein YeaQ/YmgE (transglycosylase-associated protein family)